MFWSTKTSSKPQRRRREEAFLVSNGSIIDSEDSVLWVGSSMSWTGQYGLKREVAYLWPAVFKYLQLKSPVIIIFEVSVS